MTAQDELQKLRKLIGDHATHPVRITKPTIPFRGVEIKRAERRHAAEIARWAENGEARYVGSKGARLSPAEVGSWINEAVGAYVLVGPSRELLAFANIAPYTPNDLSRIEIGRLLVAGDKRHKGFGSTLVRNLCSAVSAAYRSLQTPTTDGLKITLARVVPDNVIGVQFIESLPFNELGKDGRPDSEHRWYEYFLNRRNTEMLGEKMRELRRRLDMSQAELAFRCGVQRESINMIESGSRTASLDVLWSICRVLGRNQFERAELLLAATGEAAESSLRQYATVTNVAPEVGQNLWVASDTLAESIIEAYYEGTKQAIIDGFDRFFFIPAARWESQGEKLKNRLEADLGTRHRQNLDKHFRIYEAPEWLCYFRVVVENPTGQVAGKITVGGEDYLRFPLTETQSLTIFSFLNNGMKEADAAVVSKTKQDAAGGFRRRFPLPKGKTK